MTAALVPMETPPPLEGIPLEQAARRELCRALGLVVNVRAPSWREVMFFGKPIEFHIPKVPPSVSDRIRNLDAATFSKDEVCLEALKLAETLKKVRPVGYSPRSVSSVRPLPASRSDEAKWARSVFLIGSGPEVLPLLVGSSYLTPFDVQALAAAYPNGLDEQRQQAVQGAASFSHAGHRTGVDPELPRWLNDQLLTLMDESRPTGAFQALYQQHEQAPANGPVPQGNSRIAQQFRPDPGPDRSTQ